MIWDRVEAKSKQRDLIGYDDDALETYDSHIIEGMVLGDPTAYEDPWVFKESVLDGVTLVMRDRAYDYDTSTYFEKRLYFQKCVISNLALHEGELKSVLITESRIQGMRVKTKTKDIEIVNSEISDIDLMSPVYTGSVDANDSEFRNCVLSMGREDVYRNCIFRDCEFYGGGGKPLFYNCSFTDLPVGVLSKKAVFDDHEVYYIHGYCYHPREIDGMIFTGPPHEPEDFVHHFRKDLQSQVRKFVMGIGAP